MFFIQLYVYIRSAHSLIPTESAIWIKNVYFETLLCERHHEAIRIYGWKVRRYIT
jgi:hypothetical protein